MSEATLPRSLPMKVLWLIRKRPGHLWGAARQYYLFHKAAMIRRIPGLAPKGVELGDNVRLQKNGCLMAEAPNAVIAVGRDSVIYENASVSAYGSARVDIGEGAILGDIRIVSKKRIRIGKRFLSSWNVFIQDYDPHPVNAAHRAHQVADMVNKMRPWLSKERAPLAPALSPATWDFPGDEVVIGDDCWVGANSTILKGARIGNGCVIATGSVVVRGEYPDNSIIGGNPAKVIKQLASPGASV